MKILVVDDNDFSADLLQEIIERKDIDYIQVHNGTEAIEEFTKSAINEYKYILMDIVMDGDPGYVVAEKIRALPREDAKTVKIIATTAFAAFDVKYQGEAFDGTIMKPYDRALINKMIK